MATENGLPSVAEFYRHKDIFITGATGFVGKCLLEKLLRSVPDAGKIMILMRPKKGKSVKERLDNILASKVSKRIAWVELIESVLIEK